MYVDIVSVLDVSYARHVDCSIRGVYPSIDTGRDKEGSTRVFLGRSCCMQRA